MSSHLLITVDLVFEELGIKPRPFQAETCVSILTAMMSGKKPYVIVDAPTGTGKSIIAMVVAKCLDKLRPGHGRSVIVSSTNALVRQYESDFAGKDGVVTVFGAERYPCTLREESSGKPSTAAACYLRSPWFIKKFGDSAKVRHHCDECAFKLSREGKKSEPVVITNYSYFFIDRLFLQTFKEPDDDCVDTFQSRQLYIFDEAHRFSDHFSDHCTIYFSEKRANEYIEDIRHAHGENSTMETNFSKAFMVILENVARQTIGPANVGKFLATLQKFYGVMFTTYVNLAKQAPTESDHDYYDGVADKYRRLLCKVEDFFKYEFDVAVTCVPQTVEITVKPVFPLGIFGNALQAELNLFLSATIDPNLLAETLKLDPELIAHIKVPYSFNGDDKTVVIPPSPLRLNYERMQDPKILKDLARLCTEAINKHPSESGIVVCTSFKMANQLAEMSYGKIGHRILLHMPGTNVDDLIKNMKEAAGRGQPTVLFSPSLFEGIDLPGDVSRFQVIVKAPYHSLADKRISLIMRKYPVVYAKMTTMRLIQALGRSTRYKGDKCTSYFLDSNILRLFDSQHNVWRDQFKVVRCQ